MNLLLSGDIYRLTEHQGEGVPRDLDSLFEAMDLNRDGS